MKSLRSIAGILLLCLTASCHKDKIESIPNAENNDNDISIASSKTGIAESDWITSSGSEVATQPSHSVYHTEINADNFARSGNTIFVFRKDNANNRSAVLPYEETQGNQKIYWYYELNGDKIMISADVYGTGTNPFITSAFKYLAVSNATMLDIERRGTNRTQLMGVSYENFMGLHQ